MRNSIISELDSSSISETKKHPSFRPGDSLRIHYKIEEGAKSTETEKKFRIQIYEGVCIRYRKGGMSSSFTVRKIAANSVGVERTFPYHSPYIDQIDLISGGRVRRARLYYLRDLEGKAARIKNRRLPQGMLMTTVDSGEVREKIKKEKPVGAPKKSKASKAPKKK